MYLDNIKYFIKNWLVYGLTISFVGTTPRHSRKKSQSYPLITPSEDVENSAVVRRKESDASSSSVTSTSFSGNLLYSKTKTRNLIG